jgi:hypothetical protein
MVLITNNEFKIVSLFLLRNIDQPPAERKPLNNIISLFEAIAFARIRNRPPPKWVDSCAQFIIGTIIHIV